MSATDQITTLNNQTAQLASSQPKVTGAASSKLNQSDFLSLLTKQMQFQDPMEPMDNAQFVSQVNQFSQLESLNTISEDIKSNNGIMQTLTLVGKEADLVNPDDVTKTITGTITEAKFNSTGSVIVVDGKEYPISVIKAVRPVTSSTTSS